MTIIVWDNGYLMADTAVRVPNISEFCHDLAKIRSADFALRYEDFPEVSPDGKLIKKKVSIDEHLSSLMQDLARQIAKDDGADESPGDANYYDDHIVAWAASGDQEEATVTIDVLRLFGCFDGLRGEWSSARSVTKMQWPSFDILLIGVGYNYTVARDDDGTLNIDVHAKDRSIVLGWKGPYNRLVEMYPSMSSLHRMQVLCGSSGQACGGDIEVWGYPNTFYQSLGVPNKFMRLGIRTHDAYRPEETYRNGMQQARWSGQPSLVFNPLSLSYKGSQP